MFKAMLLGLSLTLFFPLEILAREGKRPATVLLITARQLEDAWKPFAEWKTQHGKSTKIITIDEIDEQFQAESIQEKIRLCVRQHITQEGSKWVILGGDCQRDGNGLVPGGHTTVHRQEPNGIPTDIVYLSETNWDADGDGVYGEWKDDRQAIRYPDGTIGLGRIPVRTADDVAAFTDKVIAYESRYPTSDFARTMVYTCTDTPAYPKVRNSWDGYLSKAWKAGTVRRFFSAETPWDKPGDPGSYDLSPANLVSLINEGSTGKLHIHGHGHLPAWVLEGERFTAQHVAQLKNDGAYPLITTVSCNTGEFDSPQDPSIVEQMIRRRKGGSVAVVAPVRTGKAHFHSPSDFRFMVTQGKLDGTTQTMTRYWSNGLGDELTTGESMMKAKAQMATDAENSPGYHLCVCELNLLGDPTLDMRSQPPTTPTLQGLNSFTAGPQLVQINTGAPNSKVCFWQEDKLYSIVDTDDKGIAQAQVNLAPGSLSIAIFGKSLNSVQKTIEVQPSGDA